MPNHVVTEIWVQPENVMVLRDLLSKEGTVDFNMLIPQPENIETTGCSGKPEDHVGIVCWYQWNCDHWGTKWNAYESSVGDGVIRFLTAWAHPEPVIMALSKRHPEVTYEVKYADEDIGHNCGRYTIRNGVVRKFISTDPHKFARKLWGR